MPRPRVPFASALIEGPPPDAQQWSVVLRNEQKVVLYDQTSNALRVAAMDWEDEEAGAYGARFGEVDEEGLEVISQDDSTPPATPADVCPLCLQKLANNRGTPTPPFRLPISKVASYFNLLSETTSRTNSPRHSRASTPPPTPTPEIPASTFSPGYFEAFFRIVKRLGKGGNGTVELVQHTLNGEALGLYACKKIAVGNSSPGLLRILREVHFLEALQHPNIVRYCHAWVENATFSAFGPEVPTLFILMGFSNAGSLDAFIEGRRGGIDPRGLSELSKAERIRLFRMKKQGAVHLLRLDEILSIFEDIVRGLGFLHDRNILHLDLKAENVLLEWPTDESLIPVARLSDFGSSDSTSESWRHQTTGATGTIDWRPPELLEPDPKTGKFRKPGRSTDQWALGMILHLLSFFALPYHHDDVEQLTAEIIAYKGFFPQDARSLDHGTRHDLPQSLLRIISRLVHRQPSQRISCSEVMSRLGQIRAESLYEQQPEGGESALVNVSQHSPVGEKVSLPSELIIDDTLDVVDESTIPLLLDRSPNSLQLARLSPSSLHTFRMVLGLVALVKTVTLQHTCGSLSPLYLYFSLLLPSLIDVGIADWRVSIVLGGLHFVLLRFGGDVMGCYVPPTDYGVLD